MVFEALYNGFLIGLMLSALVGPVFFTLLQTSLEQGFRAGAAVALGIAISDGTYILLMAFLSAQIIDLPYFREGLAIVGGTLLSIFGFYYLFKKRGRRKQQAINSRTLWHNVIKGVIINGINPMVFLFWLAISSYATVHFHEDGFLLRTYFITSICTVFTIDLIKSWLAKTLSQLMNERLMRRFDIAVGVILILFAMRLFYTLFEPSTALMPDNPMIPGA